MNFQKDRSNRGLARKHIPGAFKPISSLEESENPVPKAYRTSYSLHVYNIGVRSMPSTMHIPLQAPLRNALLQLSSVNRSSLLHTSSGRMIRRARPSLREADKFTKLPARSDLQSPFLSLSYRTPNIFSSPARSYIHSFKHPHSEKSPLSRPGPPCISFPNRVTALPTRFSLPVRRRSKPAAATCPSPFDLHSTPTGARRTENPSCVEAAPLRCRNQECLQRIPPL